MDYVARIRAFFRRRTPTAAPEVRRRTKRISPANGELQKPLRDRQAWLLHANFFCMRWRGWLQLLLGLCACEGTNETNLRWTVRFANPETAARASRVDVSIVSGDCDSAAVVYASSATRAAQAEGPPTLAKGEYSLRGRAITDDCRLVASGCMQLSLPAGSRSAELVLDDVPETIECTGACAERCDSPDGSTRGPLDGGELDGGELDGGELDAGEADSGTDGNSGVTGDGGSGGCPTSTPVESAAVGSHFDPAVFDWAYYLCKNPDLAAAGIQDEARARLHWLQSGMAEGRVATPGFSVTEYLQQYADLQAAFGSDYRAAVIHYVHFGIKEGRRGTLADTPNPGASLGSSLRPQGAISYDVGSGVAANDIIDIRSSARMAGGIDHLGWNGVQFINSWDHGRELQVAWSADGYGECYNPTECGSAQDGMGSTSSSLLHLFWTSNNVLASEVQPAFWNAPGVVGSCGSVTHNTTTAASHVLNKHVQVGYGGIRHVLRFLVQLTIPEDLGSLTLEGPTGYLTGEFSTFYTISLPDGTLSPLSVGPGEQSQPVILSTPDGSAAMGAWSPDLPQAAFPGAGYGRFAFPSPKNKADATMKWNVVFRRGATPAGVYNFQAFAIVGTLENVRVAMTQLRALFP